MTNPNDSAHPAICSNIAYDRDTRDAYTDVYSAGGLTKREYFAAMAMQGLIAKLDYYEDEPFVGIAKDSVSLADKLIAELNKEVKS